MEVSVIQENRFSDNRDPLKKYLKELNLSKAVLSLTTTPQGMIIIK